MGWGGGCRARGVLVWCCWQPCCGRRDVAAICQVLTNAGRCRGWRQAALGRWLRLCGAGWPGLARGSLHPRLIPLLHQRLCLAECIALSPSLLSLLAPPAALSPSLPCTEDLIIREDPDVLGGKYVGGVVTNWTLVTLHHDTQSCMDPNVIEAQVVVSSCGHDGPMGAHSVKRLSKLGMVPDVPGMAALDMNSVSAVL